MVIILFNTGLQKTIFCAYSFGKLVFCLSAPIVITACSEFDVLLFINFCNICMVSGKLPPVRVRVWFAGVSGVFVLGYHFSLKQFVRKDTRHKNLIIALNNKNMPPGSFRVLKISFIKKSVEHLQNERV